MQQSDSMPTNHQEVEQLRAKVATLEQLLEVYEQETIRKSNKLEQTLEDLHHRTQQLTHAESTLATLRSMLNSMGDAVVVTDTDGNFLFLNGYAETLLGIGDNHASLQHWAKEWALYLPDQTTRYPLLIFPLIQAMQGKSPDTTEVFIQGSHYGQWLSMTARSLCDEQGIIHGGVAVFHNITPLKQTAIALQQAESHSRKQAEQLQKAFDELKNIQMQLIQTEKMSSLGQLVAGIAHEINNPVNFIYGNLEYTRQYTQDLLNLLELYQKHYSPAHPEIEAESNEIDLEFIAADAPRLIKSMEVGAKRIRSIVSSLRMFSRLDEAEVKRVNIHDSLESTLLLLTPRLFLLKHLNVGPKPISINVIRDYGNLPPVECYAGHLNQAFMNLLSNAIDSFHAMTLDDLFVQLPCITIKTRQRDHRQVEITIQDNGVGISHDVQPQIFNPFFTTKTVGQGTGLGLSVSYQIVTQKHGGQLICESKLGVGSSFTICIPLKQSAF